METVRYVIIGIVILAIVLLAYSFQKNKNKRRR